MNYTGERVKIILAGTGEFALRVIEKIQNDMRLELLGVICDVAVGIDENREYIKRVRALGVKEISLEDKYLTTADIIFACEYRGAIPKQYVEKYRFLNCHAGILPKYRGFSANAWAIVNGETEIGYTIHQMDDKFDNGPIFYVGRFPIAREETYADLHGMILNDIVENICDIFIRVHAKELLPVKQERMGVYCTRFYAAMGDLKDFNEESEYIRNLYRSMAKPHGSGVYFWYKGEKYYPGKIQAGSDLGMEDYIGIPGKIVNCEKGTIWVKTRDNIVILSEIRMESGEQIAEQSFKIGNKLGKR